MKPVGLALSGGGTRCLVFGELLVLLEKNGYLTNVKNIWGTSAGALIGALYLLCRSAERVKALLWGLDFVSLRNVDVSNLLNIMNTWAMDNGAAMLNGIERLMEAASPGSSSKSLRDYPGLHTVIADLTLGITVVVSAENFPDLRVAEAVRASMTLPIFIRPYISPQGHIWVDGGVRANFPWLQVPAGLRDSVLGFKFSRGERVVPRNFSEFIHSMVHFDEPKKDYGRGINILEIPTPPYPAWFLRLRPEDYELITELARTSYDAWIAGNESKPSASLVHPQETSGIQIPSAPLCTHPPSSLQHCTAESSGIPQAYPVPSQDSSPRSQPRMQRISRRWSM